MNNLDGYSKEQLLDVIDSYRRMAKRGKDSCPAATLSDIIASADHVLKANNYVKYSAEQLNTMCVDCKRLNDTCSGCSNNTFTGCIFKEKEVAV